MAEREKEIAHLQKLRARHRQNVRTLEERLAAYGMERPLDLVNNLEFEREQLRQVEEQLAAAQAGTEDEPAVPGKPATTPAGGQVTVSGSGAAAVGKGAVAAGAGGVAIGGDVHGDVHVQTGGIRAERIEAENVVDGIQLHGGDAGAAAGLVDLAHAIRRGGISATEIVARNLVSGLQYIADPTQAAPDDLRREIAVLREQVEHVIAAGEIGDAADAEDVREALAKVEAELSAPTPQGSRVVRKLAEASDILTRSAEAARVVGGVGGQVIRLAPVAAALWRIADTTWGE